MRVGASRRCAMLRFETKDPAMLSSTDCVRLPASGKGPVPPDSRASRSFVRVSFSSSSRRTSACSGTRPPTPRKPSSQSAPSCLLHRERLALPMPHSNSTVIHPFRLSPEAEAPLVSPWPYYLRASAIGLSEGHAVSSTRLPGGPLDRRPPARGACWLGKCGGCGRTSGPFENTLNKRSSVPLL